MSVQRQIDQLRAQRAAEWLQLMTSGEATQADNEAFIAWVCESPRHMDELIKLIAVSRESRAAIRQAGFDREALLRLATPKVTSLSEPPSVGEAETKRSRRRFWRWTGLAAASALLALTGLWIRAEYFDGTRYATAIGEQRTVDLADGSVVYLNGKSKVIVRLADTARDIDLEGEALFRVAHDAQRPFRVHTRDAVVQAIGTQFNVDTHSGGTRVAVIEGTVQVSTDVTKEPHSGGSPAQMTPARAARLKAGEAARVSRSGAIEMRPPTEAATAAAWRQRQLVFEGTPLEEAVEEFNRYRRSMQLRLEDVPPGSHHYSGTFDADDPESFADLLSRERDLSVERRDYEIVIRPRQ